MPSTRRRTFQVPMALAVIAVGLGCVAAITAAADYVPISDEALIALRVRDVPSHLPLLGVYSRFGWHHPGPTWFYWLAPFLHGGGDSWLGVGAVTFHALMAVVTVTLVGRIERRAVLPTALAVVAVMAATPGLQLRSPWNPWVALIAGAALVAAGWSLAERRTGGAAALPVIASVMLQAHLAVAAAVLATMAASILLLVTCNRGRPIPWRGLALGSGVASALWVPPIWQQLTSTDGNLAAILRGPTGGGGPTSWVRGIGSVSRAFAVVPYAFDRSALSIELVDDRMAIPVWLIVPVVGAVLAYRCRRFDLLRGLTLAAVGVAAMVPLAATNTGLFATYLFTAVRPFSAMVFAIGICCCTMSLSRQRAVEAVEVAALLVVTAALVVGQARTRPSELSRRLMDQASRMIESSVPPTAVVSLSYGPGLGTAEVANGLLYRLESDGFSVTSDMWDAETIGEHRAALTPTAEIDVVNDSPDLMLDDGWQRLGVIEGHADGPLAILSRRPP